MAYKGLTFNKQFFTSESWRIATRRFFGNQDGRLRGLEITSSGNNIILGKGYFIASGGMVQVVSEEVIDCGSELQNATGTYKLCFELDFSKENTDFEFEQGKFVFIGANETPRQDDLFDGGTIYQLHIATVTTDGAKVTAMTSVLKEIDGDILEYLEEIHSAMNISDGVVNFKKRPKIGEEVFASGYYDNSTGDFTHEGNLVSNNKVRGLSLEVRKSDGESGSGLSLWGTPQKNALPEYGISVAKTSKFGVTNAVYGDWATYFTNGGVNQAWGWIFKNTDPNLGATGGNVFSIANNGTAYAKEGIYSDKSFVCHATHKGSEDKTGYLIKAHNGGTLLANTFVHAELRDLHIVCNSSGRCIEMHADQGVRAYQNANYANYTYVMASAFTVSSQEKNKSSIQEISFDALDKISNSVIYEYDKNDGRHEYGLIIERETPNEVVFESNVAKVKEEVTEEVSTLETETEKFVDLYSMVSLSWKALQEIEKNLYDLGYKKQDEMRLKRSKILKAFDIYKSNVEYGTILETKDLHDVIVIWYRAILDMNEHAINNPPEVIVKYL